MTAPKGDNGSVPCYAPGVSAVCQFCNRSMRDRHNLRRHIESVHTHPDPVGAAEAAERLGVKLRTFHMWAFRGIQPAADYGAVNGTRAWEWVTILRWAGERGLIESADARAEYEARFLAPATPRRLGGPLPDTAARV